MKKKLLSLLLSVAMVLSFMPFSAFAADEANTATDSTATPAVTVPASDATVKVDGENFYVFDADDFNGATFTTTIAANAGIDAAAVAGTKYIGVRIKINDATDAYYFQNSRFQVSVNIDGTEYRIDTGSDTALRRANANYFIDFKDASLSQFYGASGMWNIHSVGIESVGSVDGVMLFPLAGNPSITEELLASIDGVTFTFFDEADSGNIKASNWDNKTVYIGDISFVDSCDAYYEEYIAATGKDKYSLNDGGTAQTFTKVGPFRSYYRGNGVNNKIGTLYTAEGAVSDYAYSSGETVVHTSTLPNGDRAAALRYTTDESIVPHYTLAQLNAGTTAVNAAYVAYVQDSYRNGFGVNDSRFDKAGGPVDASGNKELDVTNIQYVAIRMAIEGGDEKAWVMWNVVGINADGSSRSLKSGSYDFIDIKTGNVSQFNLTSNRFTTTGSIDGYLIVPLNMLSSTANISGGYASIRYIQFQLTRGFYDGKTFYAGNSYFVDDYTKFKASLFAPDVELEYTATNDSITITNADGTLEYSVDGKTFNTTGEFTGLEKDTKYTISVRYKGFTKVATHEAWTSPYSTHKGDTASYLMNVYDEPTNMWGSNNGKGVNSPIHYASNDFAKNSNGTYGNNQCIKVVEDDNGETFVEFDMDEAKLTGNKQIRVYYNAFEDLAKTSQLGVSKLIDTTNVEYLAYRFKVTGVNSDIPARLGLCWGNGTFPLRDVSKAFMIDYKTGNVYTPESWSNGTSYFNNVNPNTGAVTKIITFTFDSEFDGWVVLPFESIHNSSGTDNSVKDIILGNVEDANLDNLTGVRDIQYNFYHDGTTSDWTNRNLYVGDVLVLEDAETFAKVRGCQEFGHTEGEPVKENEKPADYNNAGSYDSVVYCTACKEELSRTTIVTEPLAGALVEIGGHKYGSLADAMAAVKDGETITLSSDIVLTRTQAGLLNDYNCAGLLYFGDKNFTLDLNGFTITAESNVDNDVLRFINRGDKDNTITVTNGTIIADPNTWQAVDVGGTNATPQDGSTTLILDGLNIITYKGGSSAVRCRIGNLLKVYNTNITTGYGGGVYTDGGTTILGNGVNVTVGTGEYTDSGVGDFGVAINSCASVSNVGKLTIEGGTYTNHRDAKVEYVISLMYSSATVNITGGTFIGGRGGMIGVGALQGEEANLTITGGEFIPDGSTVLIYNEGFPGTKNITVGDVTYDKATLDWAGMTFGEGTTYTVVVNDKVVASDIEATSYELENLEPATTYNLRVMMRSRGASAIMTSTFTTPEAPINYVAQIGESKFETLEDAIAAAQAGDTIVLLDNVDVTDVAYKITKNLVLNLNGFNITGVATTATTNYLFSVNSGVTFNIIGEGTISFRATTPDTEWGEGYASAFPGYANNTINVYGTLVVEDATIENWTAKGGASYVICTYANSSLVVNSGTIAQRGGDIAIRVFTSSANAPANVTVNGGTISGNRAIWVQLASSNSAIAPIVNVNINGGVLESTDGTYYYVFYSYSYGNSFANVKVEISGGEFKGWVAFGGGYKGDTETVAVSGGTYDSGVIRWNADGSYTIFDGMLADGFAAQWDGEKYVIVDHVCEFEAVVTAPTETEVGFTTYTCSCGDSYVDNYKAPTKGKVTGVTATADGDMITITWDAVEHASKYIVYVIDSEGNTIKTAEKTTTSIAFEGIEAGEYTVKVIAKVGTWYKVANADAVAVTVEEKASDLPTGSVSGITREDAVITWDAVDGAIKYVVMIVGNGETIYRSATKTSIALSGLTVDTEYTVYINVKLASGYTGYSELLTFTTAPWAEVVLTKTADGAGYTLSWTEGVADKVWVKRIVNGVESQVAVVTNSNSINVPNTAGEYYVIARVNVDGVNRYVNSNIITIG